MLWKQRFSLPPEEALNDYDLVLGGPLVEAITRVGGAGARVALSVIHRVGDGELGGRAGELAGRLPDDGPMPAATDRPTRGRGGCVV